MNTMAPTRPALRWHGGKWKLAPWIIQHLPPHRVYVEPFGGAASVLLRKPRSYAEIYNDLDDGVVNLFRVLRDPVLAAELIRLLELTPFARCEFEASYTVADDAIEDARHLIVRSFMGFGSDGVNSEWRTGFRANSKRSGTTPAQDWSNLAFAYRALVERLRGIVIEHRDARAVMTAHDGVQTLHFVDPPYVHSTRSTKSRRRGNGGVAAYRHELSDADHVALLDHLQSLNGMVVLCGYPHALYDAALPGWRKVMRAAHADGARPRTECLWINPAASERLQGDMFAEDAA